jgi:hypothetical protein
MNGKEYEITDDVLAELAEYDPKVFEAPLVYGHPKTADPAFGWFGKLEVTGKKLFGVLDDIVPEVEDQVRKGMYKKVSASLYTPDIQNSPAPGKWYLRHVGLLGAQAPAIKGLAAVNFSENAECADFEDELTAEFSELDPVQSRLWTVGDMFRRLRDYLIEKEGAEKGQFLINDYDLEFLKREFIPREPSVSFSDPEPDAVQDEDKIKEDNTMTDAEKIAKLESDKAALQTENTGLKDRIAEQDAAALAGKIASFAESEMIGKGRLSSAKKDDWVKMMLRNITLERQATADFSEKDVDEMLADFAEMIPENSVVNLSGEPKFTKKNAKPGEPADFSEEEETVSALDHPSSPVEGGK